MVLKPVIRSEAEAAAAAELNGALLAKARGMIQSIAESPEPTLTNLLLGALVVAQFRMLDAMEEIAEAVGLADAEIRERLG